MTKMRILIIVFFVFLPLRAMAEAGKTGASFLSLGNGGRSAGMGEAQTALAEGANAIYWNPAGLGLTPSHELTLTHMQYFEDVTQQYAGLAIPLKKGRWGGMGISITHFSITDIEGRDATSARTDTLEEKDLSLQMSYGVRFLGDEGGFERDGLYMGAGVKRVSQDLAGVSAETMAFDVGFQYRPGRQMVRQFGEWIRRVSLGASSLNMGSGLKFDKEETSLPQNTKVGLGYTHFIWGDALNLAVDLNRGKDGTSKISGGGEFWIRNTFAVRLGYVGSQDVGNGLRAGAGFRFQTMQLDYAWAAFGDALGDTHRFSLGLRFGPGAVTAHDGLKGDLVKFHLSEAQGYLNSGSYHEAVLEANRVLAVDPKNAQALNLLMDAGEKLKPVDSLPSPSPETPQSPSPEPSSEISPDPSPEASSESSPEVAPEPSTSEPSLESSPEVAPEPPASESSSDTSSDPSPASSEIPSDFRGPSQPSPESSPVKEDGHE